MCRLFGYSGPEKDVTDELQQFFAGSPKHPDGWGLAAWEGDDRFIAREPCKANDSRYLNYILKSRVIPRLAIGHIRKATRGKLTLGNTHPFSRVINGKEWVLMHNGTLDITKMPEPLLYKAYGKTDSERILCLMAGVIHRGGKVKELEELIGLLSPLGKMNLLFTEGKRMFVYRNGGTLYFKQGKGEFWLSTVALDDGDWQPLEKGRLLVIRDGRVTHRSKLLHDLTKPNPKGEGVIWKTGTRN